MDVLEARRLMSAGSLIYWSDVHAGHDFVAVQGGPAAVYATVSDSTFQGKVFHGQLPAEVTTTFALSTNPVAGDSDDIVLGSTTTEPSAAYGGTVPGWNWYNAQAIFAIPTDLPTGQYYLVAYTPEAGYAVSDRAMTIVSPSSLDGIGFSGSITGSLESGDPVYLGDGFDVDIPLENFSSTPTFLIGKVFLSEDDSLDPTDVVLAEQNILLGSASSSTIELAGDLTGVEVGKTYYAFYVIDDTGGLPAISGELNTSLMYRSAPFTVQESPAERQPGNAPPVGNPQLPADPPELPAEPPVDETPAAVLEQTVIEQTLTARGRLKVQVEVSNTTETSFKGPATFTISSSFGEEIDAELFTVRKRLNIRAGDSITLTFAKKLKPIVGSAVQSSGGLAISAQASRLLGQGEIEDVEIETLFSEIAVVEE